MLYFNVDLLLQMIIGTWAVNMYESCWEAAKGENLYKAWGRGQSFCDMIALKEETQMILMGSIICDKESHKMIASKSWVC